MYLFGKKNNLKIQNGGSKPDVNLKKALKSKKTQDEAPKPPVEGLETINDYEYSSDKDDNASEFDTYVQEMDYLESQDDVVVEDDDTRILPRKKRPFEQSDDNSNKKWEYTSEEDDASQMEELENGNFEKMALQIIEEEPSPPSEKFDRYAFHQYINKNLYNDEFKSRNQLLNAFHIWKNRYDNEYINETMERLMLGRLGYCYVLKNNVLYCRVHSMLKFRDYIIPFAYIRKSDNRVVYKNYAMFRDLLNYIYYEYDNAREHKLENHNVIGLIHTLLYPRHCHLYVRLGWLTKLVYHYIKSPEDHDDSLFEITVKNEPIYVFEKMRSVEAQQIVIDKLRGHFKWMYPPFNKSDESIRKFIYYYYTEMCGKATVKAPFLYKRF